MAGIISQLDVLSVFDRRDEEIREEIINEVIPRVSEPSWYSVRVKDGIVTVEGTPETVPGAREVLAQIRDVQGVVAVRDHLPAAPGHGPVAVSHYLTRADRHAHSGPFALSRRLGATEGESDNPTGLTSSGQGGRHDWDDRRNRSRIRRVAGQ